MKEKLKGYQKRLFIRMQIAKKIGRIGFYTVTSGVNEGKQYPKPMYTLQRMIGSEGGING